MEAALRHKAPSLAPTHPSAGSPDDFAVPAGMARAQFRAMGTTVSLLLLEQHIERGTQAVQALFAEWERTLSRFLPESELSSLNQRTGRFVLVSPLLFTVMEAALTAAEATNGLYDPTLLYQLHDMGYDRSFDILDKQQAAHDESPLRMREAWRSIELERRLRLVQIPEGVGVDFGGIAKGMAVDAALARLQEMNMTPALVNAGGDLSVLGTPPDESSWPIAVEVRRDSAGTIRPWIVPLHHGSMATSGISRRHWQQGTQARHHIIDPRTGQSAQNEMESVSVVTAHCEQAEVAAKVAFLLGMERGSEFLQHYNIAALLVRTDGIYRIVGSWPREDMSLEVAQEQKDERQ